MSIFKLFVFIIYLYNIFTKIIYIFILIFIKDIKIYKIVFRFNKNK